MFHGCVGLFFGVFWDVRSRVGRDRGKNCHDGLDIRVDVDVAVHECVEVALEGGDCVARRGDTVVLGIVLARPGEVVGIVLVIVILQRLGVDNDCPNDYRDPPHNDCPARVVYIVQMCLDAVDIELDLVGGSDCCYEYCGRCCW